MKVIGIVGSPRKGANVETLVQTVLDAAKEKGHVTEKFNLNELEFCGCQACMYCKSHDHCKLDDGLTQVLDAVKDADAVVFGAPIYMFLGKDFKISLPPGKKAVIVTSQGNPDAKMFEGVAQTFATVLKMYGFHVIDTIQMIDGNNPLAIMERKDLLDRATKAGNQL
jgi:FMN-dependent NADH-azoreductase